MGVSNLMEIECRIIIRLFFFFHFELIQIQNTVLVYNGYVIF